MDNWGYLFFNESMMGFWHALLWIVVMAIVIGITILSTRKYFERIARQRQPQKTLDELEENYRAISRQRGSDRAAGADHPGSSGEAACGSLSRRAIRRDNR